MRKLIAILLFMVPALMFGQQSVKYRQITQDTARLKNLSAHPDSILGYGTLYSKGDSIYFMDQNENIYNILLWIDSVAALRSSITSLSGDQNDIANNTWFTSYDGLGNPMNAWKVNDQGVIEFGTNVAIGSLYTVADAGSVWIANMPVVSSVYGTKMEYKIGIDDSGIFRVLGYSDGGGAIYGPEVVVTGNMTVTGDVGITGDVTITGDIGLTGKLTASDSVLVPLRAYNATTWNNSTRAASEDAIRDKIESLTTFSSGTSYNWTANQTMNDGYKWLFGTSGVDGELYSDGTDNIFKLVGGADYKIINASSTTMYRTDGSHNYLYDGGSVKLQTLTTGITVTGTGSFTGEIDAVNYHTVKVSLNNSEVYDAYDTPHVLIAAPGTADMVIEVTSITIRINYLTAAFTDTYFAFGSSSTVLSGVQYMLDNSDVTTTSTKIFRVPMGNQYETDTADVGYEDNLVVGNNEAFVFSPTADVVSGGGSIDLYITYRIITL